MNTQLQKLNSLDRRVGKVTSTEQIPIANEIKKRASNVSRETSKREVSKIFDNFFEIRRYQKLGEIMVSCCKFLRYVFSLLNNVVLQLV